MSLIDINFTEPKLKDFKCFRLPIDNLPKYKEVLIFGNVYNFFGTFIDDDFGFTQTAFSGEGSADNFMNFGQFVMNDGHATIIASKETCNYYRRLYKEFYKAGFGTTHPKVNFFEIDDIKFLTGKFKIKEGKEEKIVKGEYFWSQNEKDWNFNYLNFIKTIKEKGYYINNNMFDFIIGNPPYGKSSSLSRKIVNTLLENRVSKEMIVLAPFNTYTNSYKYVSDFKFLGATDQYFTDVSLHGLSLARLSNKKIEIFETWDDLLFSTVSKELVLLKDAVCKYNESHKSFYKALHNWIGRNAENIKKVCNEKNSFLVTLWQPQNKVHVDESAMDIQHNLKDNPIKWGKDDGGLIEFRTRKEFENFRDWFYKKPGHSKEAQNTFIYRSLSFLDQAYNGGTTVLKYPLVLPNLDWTHPWTDREILKEIGLPEDFLEKEKEETTACKNY